MKPLSFNPNGSSSFDNNETGAEVVGLRPIGVHV
jgi:hypothetical protein